MVPYNSQSLSTLHHQDSTFQVVFEAHVDIERLIGPSDHVQSPPNLVGYIQIGDQSCILQEHFERCVPSDFDT
jgi:hypothetical protein